MECRDPHAGQIRPPPAAGPLPTGPRHISALSLKHPAQPNTIRSQIRCHWSHAKLHAQPREAGVLSSCMCVCVFGYISVLVCVCMFSPREQLEQHSGRPEELNLSCLARKIFVWCRSDWKTERQTDMQKLHVTRGIRHGYRVYIANKHKFAFQFNF